MFILEQFYNAKKKKEFLLIFEAIFRFLFVKVFLSIKTPHMREYILAVQNLLVVICISYKTYILKFNIINEKKQTKTFASSYFASYKKQFSLLQSRACSSRRNYNFARFRSKMWKFFLLYFWTLIKQCSKIGSLLLSNLADGSSTWDES
jgi:hypothetical protein